MRLATFALALSTSLVAVACATPAEEDAATDGSALSSVERDALTSKFAEKTASTVARAHELGVVGRFRATATETFLDDGEPATATTKVFLEVTTETVCDEAPTSEPQCGPEYRLEVEYKTVRGGRERVDNVRTNGRYTFVHTAVFGNDGIELRRVSQGITPPAYGMFWVAKSATGTVVLDSPSIGPAYLPTIAPILSGRPDFWPSTSIVLVRDPS